MTSTPGKPLHAPTLHHLEQLMAGLLEGVILIDPTGVILSANPAALKMHGVRGVGELGATADDYAARFALRYRDGRPNLCDNSSVTFLKELIDGPPDDSGTYAVTQLQYDDWGSYDRIVYPDAVPRVLRPIIERCLERNPDRRYAGVDRVIQELEGVMPELAREDLDDAPPVFKTMRFGDPGSRVSAVYEARVDPGVTRELVGDVSAALDRLGLEARGGTLINGADRIEAAARAGKVHLLVHAADASEDGRRTLDQAWRVGGGQPRGLIFPEERSILSMALGRENVVHVALTDPAAASRVYLALARWRAFTGPERGPEGGEPALRTDLAEADLTKEQNG